MGLLWSDVVVPGSDLLILKTTYTHDQEIFYRRYEFAGITGNSLQINISGGRKGKDETSAPSAKSMEKTIYVERAEDGAFYFVPDDLIGEGSIKIVQNSQSLGIYLVTLNQRQK